MSQAGKGKTVLVVGGAGYIGSHMVKSLLAHGYETVTFDNLSHGHRDAVLGGHFVRGDLADRELLEDIFEEFAFDGVLHFAGSIQVGESVRDPQVYYDNNLANTLNLLRAVRRGGNPKLIFSSSAAVYGEPCQAIIDERHPCAPLSPYGRSKLMVEQIAHDFAQAYGLRIFSLRYFNAAGADPDGDLGERHTPETHLIPLALRAAFAREPFEIFGGDYPTPDGSCIRDYIHVADLCEAHRLALEYLPRAGGFHVLNLGNGAGYSVREVVSAIEWVTGQAVSISLGPRRAGDPVRLVADAKRARAMLGWKPRYGAIETIVAHAAAFEQQLHHYRRAAG